MTVPENVQVAPAQTRQGDPEGDRTHVGKESGSTVTPLALKTEESDVARFNRLKERFSELRDYLAAAAMKHGKAINTSRAESTKIEYRKVLDRAIKGENGVELPATTGNPWTKLRMALVTEGYAAMLEGKSKAIEASSKRDFAAVARWVDYMETGKGWIDASEVQLPVPEKEGNKQKKNSARTRIKEFADGWEEVFHTEAILDRAFYRGICVIMSTGARPVEVLRTVVIQRIGPDCIAFKIKTAKTSKDRGVGLRTITLRCDAPWVRALSDALGSSDALEVSITSTKMLYNHVVAISRRCFTSDTQRRLPIIPYVFRHRMAVMLKSSEWSETDQAKVMGHASCNTMSKYGTHNIRVSRAGFPLKVTAEREPRPRRPTNGPPKKKSTAPEM